MVRELKLNQRSDEYFAGSELIMKQIEMLPEFMKAEVIMAYWSIKGEVYTHEAIRRWSKTKTIVLPSVDGNVMNLKLFTSSDSLIAGDLYSIPEPDGPLFIDYDAIDLIIVPGVAFDRRNNRMGRGKAYYDKFLRSLNTTKAGVCFSFQLFDSIPCDEHDIAMDKVIAG